MKRDRARRPARFLECTRRFIDYAFEVTRTSITSRRWRRSASRSKGFRRAARRWWARVEHPLPDEPEDIEFFTAHCEWT